MMGHEVAVKGVMAFAPEGKATKVTWTDRGDAGMHPGYRLMAFFAMGKIMGGHFDRSLAALKGLAEAKK